MKELSPNHIRFKFMPTPSDSLHIGHAWLLFIMDCLVRQAKRAGREADIVIVFDGIISLSLGYNTQQILETSKKIIEDTTWLNIQFTEAVNNLSFPYTSESQSKLIHFIRNSEFAHASLCPSHLHYTMLGDKYYIKNCIIDTMLGVTHIIRGGELLTNTAIYRTFYEFLGIQPPLSIFVPFISDSNGTKISKEEKYTIRNAKEYLTRDKLFSVLFSNCLNQPNNSVSTDSSTEQCEKELLGTDWDWILGGADASSKLMSFLSRFKASPRIYTKCVLVDNQCYS